MRIQTDVPYIEDKIFGRTKERESNKVQFKISLELNTNERELYIGDYLNLPVKVISPDSFLMKRVVLTFIISVNEDMTKGRAEDNHLLINKVEISDMNNDLIPIMSELERERNLNVALFQKDVSSKFLNIVNTEDKDSVNDYLRNAITNDTSRIDAFSVLSSRSVLAVELLIDFISKLEFIDPFRQSEKTLSPAHLDPEGLDTCGTNLLHLIDTMYHNDYRRFQEVSDQCKKIFPDIIDIHPKSLPDHTVTIVINKRNVKKEIQFREEAAGFGQLLIIIWKIATARSDTMWFIDEPELHLHPGAQQVLYELLKEESKRGKQIFVATHSMVFMHNSSYNEVSLVLYDDGESHVIPLEDVIVDKNESDELMIDTTIREHVYNALGYDSTFAFEPRTIAIVEGKADKEILLSFSKILGMPVNPRATRIIPVGDRIKAENYIPILLFTVIGKKCLIVLDNDDKDPTEIKNKILRREIEYKKSVGARPIPLLTDENFHLYPEKVYSIEYYLLEQDAILRAAGVSDTSSKQKVADTLQQQWPEIMDKRVRPKDVLKKIWEEDICRGPYNEVETASEISKYISRNQLEQYDEINNLIKAMTI